MTSARNPAMTVRNRNLRTVIEEKAKAHPKRTFLLFDYGVQQYHYTYGQFDACVNKTANALLELGVAKNDKVNLHLHNTVELLFAWFATAKIGAVMVPTNPSSPPSELLYPVAHSGSVVSITEPGLLETVKTVQANCPELRTVIVTGRREFDGAASFDKLIAEQSNELDTIQLGSFDDLAIMYTSGTTSKPKGVLLSHANYVFKGEVVARTLNIVAQDRHLISLPLYHANAQYHLLAALTAGASAVVTPRFSASRFMEQASSHGCTLATLFAAPVRMILAQSSSVGDQQNGLRLVTFAQRLSEDEIESWHKRFGAPLLQIYGQTETMGMVMANPIDGPRDNMTSGTPVIGYRVSIVDDENREVRLGSPGHLVVHGKPGLEYMKCYYRDSKATDSAVRGGMLWTGDIMETSEKGFLRFVDRAKDMIKRGGENVSPAEVEIVIECHPAVAESTVIGIPDLMRDESIKAFVILKSGWKTTAREIMEFCKARLSPFRVPEYVEFVDEFPRTIVGKVQRYRLRR